jgi:hypothetical protein
VTEESQPLYSTCDVADGIAVCGPPRGVYRRIESAPCPECKTDHSWVQRWDGAWYGTTFYGSCGDTWQDGYRMRRPFARYWRREAIKHFTILWDSAVPDDLYDAYVRADCDFAAADDWEEAAVRRDAAVRAIWKYQEALAEKER